MPTYGYQGAEYGSEIGYSSGNLADLTLFGMQPDGGGYHEWVSVQKSLWGALAGYSGGISMRDAGNPTVEYGYTLLKTEKGESPYFSYKTSPGGGVTKRHLGFFSRSQELDKLRIGSGTTTGNRSISVGASVFASGDNSAAFGYYAQALGNNSMSFGKGNYYMSNRHVITSVGDGSFAGGVVSSASFAGGAYDYEVEAIKTHGEGSFAFGSVNSYGEPYDYPISIYAHGQGSVCMGYGEFNKPNRTYGKGSIALGRNAIAGKVASTETAVALGRDVYAEGNGATAFGYRTRATGRGSLSFGFGNTLSSASAITASGRGSFAGGDIVENASNESYYYSEIVSSGAGSIARGLATYQEFESDTESVYINNKIEASGAGSGAFGSSAFLGKADVSASRMNQIQSNPGYFRDRYSIIASASNAFQFGPGTNDTRESLQIGQDFALKMSDHNSLSEYFNKHTLSVSHGNLYLEYNGSKRRLAFV